MKKEKMPSEYPRQNICYTKNGIVKFVKTVIIIHGWQIAYKKQHALPQDRRLTTF